LIPENIRRHAETSPPLRRGAFGISRENLAYVASLLRDLYSNKARALLREYHSNGADAHVEAGIPDRPVKVVLPTEISPIMVVRDWGPGLSEENMYAVFSQYGASTKRETNDQHGMMGIGSKAAFSLTDSFQVTSWFNGVKTVYIAYLDESDMGMLDKVHESPCEDETGLEIRATVPQEEVPHFHREACFLFRWVNPQPEINIDLPEPVTGLTSDLGAILPEEPEWLAVMGGVPYVIDRELLAGIVGPRLETSIRMSSGVFMFTIGEVDIAPNREGLKFTKKTRKRIRRAAWDTLMHFVGEAREIALDTSRSPWERRLNLLQWKSQAGALPWPEEADGLNSPIVKMFTGEVINNDGEPVLTDGKVTYDKPKTFHLRKLQGGRYRNSITLSDDFKIRIGEMTRIIVHDSLKPVSRFVDTGTPERVVIVAKGYSLLDVQAELQERLRLKGLEGIPILRTSEMKRIPKTRSATSRTFNPKHKARWFKLTSTHDPGRSRSANWSIVEDLDDIEPGSIAVVLSHFYPRGFGSNFYSIIRAIRSIEMAAGRSPTPIYGMKTLDRDPVTIEMVVEQCQGVDLQKWMTDFLESEAPDNISDLCRARRVGELFRWQRKHFRAVRELFKEHPVGQRHTIARYCRLILDDYDLWKALPAAEKQQVNRLVMLYQHTKEGRKLVRNYPHHAKLRKILIQYPLLAIRSDLKVIAQNPEPWMEYITLMDNKDS